MTGFLSRVQRRGLWAAFLLMAAYAPFTAWLTDDATWFLSIVVAGLVATVLIADDFERDARRARRD
ncbi:hypothetical protein [Catellatospora citrea]|uniref:Uncharacterized protein n=1 Tax=Catellatospora citrea TaxID=53366 RepID=A0A8J3P278_9ACTN|nr:hypothetical protein [Catellatospora citrea]RKE10772.1 hypothetical protein C8E86_5690 [Catellatospora citrea]GIG00992.1 hypothetical protein Cci01nite_60850 [Catellatospora citrea]